MHGRGTIFLLVLASVNWTVVGVLLTAVFTGGTLVTAWLAYSHGLRLAGDRRPIRIRKRIPGLGFHDFGGEEREIWEKAPERYDVERVRVAILHLFNLSGETQIVRFHGTRSRILWPRSARDGHIVPMDEVELEPRRGGNVTFLHVNHGDWEGKDAERKPPDSMRFKRRYWLKLTGTTRSGLKVRYLGPVRLDAFPGSKAWSESVSDDQENDE